MKPRFLTIEKINSQYRNQLNTAFLILLFFVIMILIGDQVGKVYYYFHYGPGPGGSIITNTNDINSCLPVLHPGITALQIPGFDSPKPTLGKIMLVIEASLAIYLLIRFLFQGKQIILHNHEKHTSYIFPLSLGKRMSQKFAYIVVFLCLLSSVIDRSYSKDYATKGHPSSHRYAIIDWINIHYGYLNLTDIVLLVLGIFIIVSILFHWFELACQHVVKKTMPITD